MADTIIQDILTQNANSTLQQQTTTVRHFVSDFNANRYNFRTRYQRKPVWRRPQKSEWVLALLKHTPVDPLSISIRGREKRGVNGGNRARATVDYVANRFPMEVVVDKVTYYYWFSQVPESKEVRGTGNPRYHRVLPAPAQERYLEAPLYLNIRTNLSESDEIEWYINMNKNQKAHSKGTLLNAKICQHPNDTWVIELLRNFSHVKPRFQIPLSEEDEGSLASRLETVAGCSVDTNDERDEREDNVLTAATLLNLLANGQTYKDDFRGRIDMEVLEQNIAMVLAIFEGYEASAQMKEEFASPSTSKKPFQSKFWSCAYLLGPIFWSVAHKKENVVAIWREFLRVCTVNMINTIYLTEINDRHDGDDVVAKYQVAWERVTAFRTNTA